MASPLRNFPMPKIDADAKEYSRAVRELFGLAEGVYPDTWPADRKQWSRAQKMADKHYELSKAGTPESGGWARLLIERAEGRVPHAPEDRDAMLRKAGMEAESRADGLSALLAALGMKRDAIDSEVVIDTPALRDKNDD